MRGHSVPLEWGSGGRSEQGRLEALRGYVEKVKDCLVGATNPPGMRECPTANMRQTKALWAGAGLLLL